MRKLALMFISTLFLAGVCWAGDSVITVRPIDSGKPHEETLFEETAPQTTSFTMSQLDAEIHTLTENVGRIQSRIRDLEAKKVKAVDALKSVETKP